MTSSPNQPEDKVTAPSSQKTIIFKCLFYVVVLGGLILWFNYDLYKSYQLEVGFLEMETWSEYNYRHRGWAWRALYYHLLQPALVGLVTYRVLMIDLKWRDKPFFTKYKLVPVFISFGVTPPLVSLPFATVILLGVVDSGYDISKDIWDFIFNLVTMGQLYWFLLPIQAAITIFGKNFLFMGLGYIVIALANICSILFLLCSVYMVAFMGRTHWFY